MMHIGIGRPATAFFRIAFGLPARAPKTMKACALDRRTLRALQPLSEDELDDIGLCRKPRRIRSDYLGREPRQEVKFEYYRLDMQSGRPRAMRQGDDGSGRRDEAGADL